MPCTVTGSLEGDARLAAQEAHEIATLATRVACEALRLLDEHNLSDHLSEEAAEWAMEHARIDAEREARERREHERSELQQQARAKLSPAELRALGLD